MSSKLTSFGFAAIAAVCVSSAAAQDQLSDYAWGFTTTGPANASGAVSAADEITLTTWGSGATVTAEAVALDTGRLTITLAAQQSSNQFDFCGGTAIAVGNTCVDCSPINWCVDPVFVDQMGANMGGTQTLDVTWSVDVVEGRCWQIAMSQDPFSFECGSQVVASIVSFEPAPEVAITSIEPKPAYKSSIVTLTGTGFDSVESVLVNGFETAILSQSTNALVVRPAKGPAGFVDVTLRDDTFLLAETLDGLTHWPAATAQVAAGSLDVGVDAGLPGDWQLVLSLGTMPPVSFGSTTYGQLWVDVVSSPWVWLPGSLDANGHGELSLALPSSAGLSGLTVHVQARTPAGFSSGFTAAFSNRLAVELP